MLWKVQCKCDDNHAEEEEEKRIENEFFRGSHHVEGEGDLILISLSLQPPERGREDSHSEESYFSWPECRS